MVMQRPAKPFTPVRFRLQPPFFNFINSYSYWVVSHIITKNYLYHMKILVMGLPGSGKTYLTERLQPLLEAAWYNADKVREMANDWDFSDAGRMRQADRMRTFADFEKKNNRFVICDFVCPTKETRKNFDADITIWMDTIDQGRFEDTNKIFTRPEHVDFHIKEWNDKNHINLAHDIKNKNV